MPANPSPRPAVAMQDAVALITALRAGVPTDDITLTEPQLTAHALASMLEQLLAITQPDGGTGFLQGFGIRAAW